MHSACAADVLVTSPNPICKEFFCRAAASHSQHTTDAREASSWWTVVLVLAGQRRRIDASQHPSSIEHSDLQARMEEKKTRDEYCQQLEQLANRKGRSWSYHECTLILTLVIGIVLHYNETPTQALHTVSTLIRRSYYLAASAVDALAR